MVSEKTLNIIGNVIRLAIIIPTLIFGIMVMMEGVNNESAQEVQNAFKESTEFNVVLFLAYFSLIACAALMVFFFVVMLITRPATAIKSVLGIIVAGAFFFILYSIGSPDTNESLKLGEQYMVEQSVLDFTHAGIITTLVALILSAALALFMGPIVKLIRKN
ncbi:MAG: hypothetical protein R3277_01830 [Brumimicrobium sp.]|nr:hypothetical protein [Brumimicrobium sp.]